MKLNEPELKWLYLVHNERTDDPGLMYTVLVSTNLVNAGGVINSNVWNTNGVEFAGSSVFSNVWKTVTNRTEAVEGAKFIKLQVGLYSIIGPLGRDSGNRSRQTDPRPGGTCRAPHSHHLNG